MLQSMVAYAADTRHRKLKRNKIQRSLNFVRTVERDEMIGSYQLAVRRISTGVLGLQVSQIMGFKWVV